MRVVLLFLSAIFFLVGIVNLFGGDWNDLPAGAWRAGDYAAHSIDIVLQFGAAWGFFVLASRRKNRDRNIK